MIAAIPLFLALAQAPAGTASAPDTVSAPPPAAATAADLAGAWSGMATHEGDTTPFALELETAADGGLAVKATIPAVHVRGQSLGSYPLAVDSGRVRFGPFSFTYDSDAGTLAGLVPQGLAPVYEIPLVLYRVDRILLAARPEPSGPLVQPAWAFEAGSPLWAGPRFSGGTVYVGGEDGRLHAVEASTGSPRWTYQAGGAIRARPTVAGSSLYFQADDGFLYKLATADGRLVWRVKVVGSPIVRLPFDDPRSRYDRFASDVTVADGRLYLGTHDGHVLALEAADGAALWSFATGDAVLAAPAVDSSRVYAGSFDHHVYALDPGTGDLLWKRDTRGAVVSTPAVAGDRILVGNRAYDLLALDVKTGEVVWKDYIWFSWIESSATVRDGVAYVGSSDAASVFACDAVTGRRRWAADVFGWAWGQPAVAGRRVFACTSSQAGYPAGHRAGVMALDRTTGETVWRYEVPAAASGAFGFPGSPDVGDGLVFVSGLDGRLYAFEQ